MLSQGAGLQALSLMICVVLLVSPISSLPPWGVRKEQFHRFCSKCLRERSILRRRPYRIECTGSLLTSEVKQCRARSVLGWGTAWEDLRVLSAFYLFNLCRDPDQEIPLATAAEARAQAQAQSTSTTTSTDTSTSTSTSTKRMEKCLACWMFVFCMFGLV